ncbi:polysaccharide biosynthesis protein [bacterium]|nr:polysaccharide biosynthesis protein [bacterium]
MLVNLKKIAQKNTPRWVILLFDLFIATFSFLLASYILDVYSTEYGFSSNMMYPLFVVLIFRAKGFLITRSYTGILKYTSTQDAVRIFFAVIISTAGISLVEILYRFATGSHILQPEIIVIDAFILVCLLSAFRISFKLMYNHYSPYKSLEKKQIIIYGAGETGVLVKRSLEGDPKLNSKVVAFLDDNAKLHGKTLEGVKIHSADIDFNQLPINGKVVELVIAIQQLKPWRKKRIIEKSLAFNIAVKTIPSVGKWFNGEFNPRQIKKVKIEDLLQRDPIQLDKETISSELNDKVILVTGAAGSIGSEIARQSLAFNPRKLVLLDQAESALYDLQNELKNSTQVEIVIADVCNPARVKKVFEYFNPSYVFHAAAYKHVPLMENNPYEAINTNVFGTQNLANMAVAYKVEKFVYVSTDKAVNPTNIMGASKRIGEIYVQSLNEKLRLETDIHTKFITTRFGNVLGSNGSVIPLFERQIEEGGPVTVTHPDITRYFMTIPEACQLVLEAGVMGKGGEIYIFDMGESVKIVDLARKMIRLSGLDEGKDIDIVYTGLRPGEKLKEELLSDKENTIGTHNPKIMIAKVPQYNYLEVNEVISKLYKEKDTLTNRFLVKTMKRIVPEYVSNNSIYEELDKQLIDS